MMAGCVVPSEAFLIRSCGNVEGGVGYAASKGEQASRVGKRMSPAGLQSSSSCFRQRSIARCSGGVADIIDIEAQVKTELRSESGAEVSERKEVKEGFLLIERGPKGKVMLVKRTKGAKLEKQGIVGEKPLQSEIKEEISENIIADLQGLEEITLSGLVDQGVGENQGESKASYGNESLLKPGQEGEGSQTREAEAAASGDAGGNGTANSAVVSSTRAVSKAGKDLEEKVQGFVRILLEAKDEEEVDKVLKDAESHIGSGRRAWRQAMRTILMSDKWKPKLQDPEPEVPPTLPQMASDTNNDELASDTNIKIAQALEEGDMKTAVESLEAALLCGMKLSQYVASQTLASLGRKSMVTEAESLFKLLMKSGYKTSRVFHNCMVSAYGEVGDFEKMEMAAKRMQSMGVSPDIVTYNTLANKYLKGGDLEKAMEIFNEMKARGYTPNVRSYNAVLGLLRDKGQVEQAEELLRAMAAEGCNPSLVSYNIVATGYADSGRVEDVERIFQEMLDAGFEPNNITLGTCMAAFRNIGDIEKVEEYFGMLQRYKIRPDVVTLSILATAYKKVDRAADQARVQRQIDLLNGRQRAAKRAGPPAASEEGSL